MQRIACIVLLKRLYRISTMDAQRLPCKNGSCSNLKCQKKCAAMKNNFRHDPFPKILLIENDPVAAKEIRATLAAARH